MIQESEMTLTFPLKKQKYIPKVISDNFANKIFEGIIIVILIFKNTNSHLRY